jgi:hypothetical protein
MVPSSTFDLFDTSFADWEQNYLIHKMENAPFGIKMNPIHPDTMASFVYHFGDSAYDYYHMAQQDSNFNINVFSVAAIRKQHFSGTVTGRLVDNIVNDLGNTVQIPLTGVKVKLIENDKLFDDQFGGDVTDANGEFSITFTNIEQTGEDGNIELRLEFLTENSEFNFKIVNSSFGAEIKGASAIRGEVFLGTFSDNQTINLGDVGADAMPDALVTTHFFTNAYSYVSDNVPNDIAEDLVEHQLIVRANDQNGNNFIPQFGSAAPPPTMRLRSERLRHENTIYHEFGHYLHWVLMGFNWPDPRSDEDCLPDFDAFFEHGYSEPSHIRLAWTEGFANYIRYVLDAAFWEEDSEFQIYGQGGARNRTANETERIRNLALVFDAYRSEAYIGSAMYDLWDGPNKNLPELSDPSDLGVLANIEGVAPALVSIHPFDDSDGTGFGSNWSGPDDIEFTFAQTLEPIIKHGDKIVHFQQYIHALIAEVDAGNCNSRQGIMTVLEANFFNSTDYSTDPLYVVETTEHDGKNLQCQDKTDIVTEFVNPVEVPGQNLTINIPHSDWLDDEIDRLVANSVDLNDPIEYATNFTPYDNLVIDESISLGDPFSRPTVNKTTSKSQSTSPQVSNNIS